MVLRFNCAIGYNLQDVFLPLRLNHPALKINIAQPPVRVIVLSFKCAVIYADACSKVQVK